MDRIWTRRLTKRGYYEVLTDQGWKLEHILVSEQVIGRRLKRTESVHHINCIKTDNRPINLFVCSRLEHNKAHGMGRISLVKVNKSWKSKACINCGKVFYGPEKMMKSRLRCSGSCKPIRLQTSCEVCGKVYTVPRHAAHVKHCSRRCRRLLT